jgi:tetratricopeptide (TPR) repeat protein
MEGNHATELDTLWDEARINVEQGSDDKAIEIYKYILIMYPDDKFAVEYANCYLGDIYLALQHPDLAERYIEKAIKLNPGKPKYRYQLGV